MSKHKQKPNSSFTKIIQDKEDLSDYLGIVYTRVSSLKQEIEGSGHESQEKRCIEILKSKNIPYQMTFRDTFTGGGDFTRRPGMMALLNYIDSNPHKKFVVIFDDLKRFARDVENHIKLKLALTTREVKLLCANHTFEDTPEGEAMEMVSAVFAQLDRKTNRRQVIQKQHARLTLGYNAFPAHIGYSKEKSVIHGNIDIPNEKAKYLREGLEGFASMRFVTKSDLARFLQDNDVISKKQGVAKALATVDKILSNKFYAGIIEYVPWDVFDIPGKHRAIISYETYEKNQSRLNKKVSLAVRRDLHPDFELRGLVSCADCGNKLTAANSKGKVGTLHPYYRCQNKACIACGVSIKAKDLHDGFYSLLNTITAKPELIELAAKIFSDEWKTAEKKIEREKHKSHLSENELDNKISNLSLRISVTNNPTLIQAYEEEIEKLVSERTSLREKKAQLYDYKEIYKTTLEEVLNVYISPYSVWNSYTIEQKHKFFGFIFSDKLTYSKNQGYKTPNYALPIRLFEEIRCTHSVNVEVGGIEPPCKE